MRDYRPSTDEVLMANALEWAKRSTCSRAQVGCVISREGRILSTGYNGAPSRMPHCDHSCTCPRVRNVYLNSDHVKNCESQKPCTNVIHSEANAIAFAAKHGVPTVGATLHTTRVPCMTCAGLIINAGLIRVMWLENHRDMEGLDRLTQAGLEVVRWNHD